MKKTRSLLLMVLAMGLLLVSMSACTTGTADLTGLDNYQNTSIDNAKMEFVRTAEVSEWNHHLFWSFWYDVDRPIVELVMKEMAHTSKGCKATNIVYREHYTLLNVVAIIGTADFWEPNTTTVTFDIYCPKK